MQGSAFQMVCGIDPGQTGAIGMVCGTLWQVTDMPDSVRGLVDYFLDYVIRPNLNVKVYIEQVGLIPGQMSAKGGTTFMKHCGQIEGVLTAMEIPYELVTPGVWMKAMGCLTRGNKDVTYQKALAMFPSLKITRSNSEAMLL